MKTEKEVTQISAKLNPEFDMELIENISKIPKRERSYTYREALNKYFKDKQEEEK
jgi:predicted DNA-binding protein